MRNSLIATNPDSNIFWLRDESLQESDASAAQRPPVQAVQSVPVVKSFEGSGNLPDPDGLAQETVEDFEAASNNPRNRRDPGVDDASGKS